MALVGSVALAVLILVTLDVDFLNYIVAVLVLVTLGWFLGKLAQWATTFFVLTTERVIYRSGLVSKKGTEIPLDNISAVLFSQRAFERVLGLGDITVQSSAAQGDAVFDDIRRPGLVQKRIYEEMNAQKERDAQRYGRAGAAASGSLPPPASVPEQIAQLAALRDQGHLTEAEFEHKKADLLRRM